MDRNRVTEAIAARVREAIEETGATVPNVARAADITTRDMNDRLEGRAEFEITELVRVGGFLRLPIDRFLEVAA